jgi:hypothetical protein
VTGPCPVQPCSLVYPHLHTDAEVERSRAAGLHLPTRDEPAEAGLTSFLYILMRDEVTPGAVERLVVDHVEKAKGSKLVTYSNVHLAAYARELARRILSP